MWNFLYNAWTGSKIINCGQTHTGRMITVPAKPAIGRSSKPSNFYFSKVNSNTDLPYKMRSVVCVFLLYTDASIRVDVAHSPIVSPLGLFIHQIIVHKECKMWGFALLHFLHPEVGCCDTFGHASQTWIKIILFHFEREVEFNININEWYK